MTKVKSYKNNHKANAVTLEKINQLINGYPKQYQTPKYLSFMKDCLVEGFEVEYFDCRPSKYVFVYKGDDIIKIRFSNHKPSYFKEIYDDCDFYVGISHTQVSTTEQVFEYIKRLKTENGIKRFVY